MDRSLLCFFVASYAILQWSGSTCGSPLSLNLSNEGSGYWEPGKADVTPSPSIISKGRDLLEPTTPIVKEEATQVEHHLLTEIVDFLRENLFLILVVTCLVVVICFILCSAAILSRRLKMSSYYPCSFPAKMYVDETDRTGGGRFFSEVPEKMSGSSNGEEPTNSAKQLQEDIMMATRNLRTPTKTPWREEKDGNAFSTGQVNMEKSSAETERESEGIPRSMDEVDPQQRPTKEPEDEISPGDTGPADHMEKSDPPSSDLSAESEHPSGPDDSGAQEDEAKQEVPASATSFISEEKTAF